MLPDRVYKLLSQRIRDRNRVDVLIPSLIFLNLVNYIFFAQSQTFHTLTGIFIAALILIQLMLSWDRFFRTNQKMIEAYVRRREPEVFAIKDKMKLLEELEKLIVYCLLGGLDQKADELSIKSLEIAELKEIT